jgi:hypothetical protein
MLSHLHMKPPQRHIPVELALKFAHSCATWARLSPAWDGKHHLRDSLAQSALPQDMLEYKQARSMKI